uniref:Uncharacterized protein n=1 Tax=Romanomermis culicivorax TaxID=13658 RepID=A0A915K113_ROMCU
IDFRRLFQLDCILDLRRIQIVDLNLDAEETEADEQDIEQINDQMADESHLSIEMYVTSLDGKKYPMVYVPILNDLTVFFDSTDVLEKFDSENSKILAILVIPILIQNDSLNIKDIEHRNEENYSSHVAQLESGQAEPSEFGIKFDSPFNCLKINGCQRSDALCCINSSILSIVSLAYQISDT